MMGDQEILERTPEQINDGRATLILDDITGKTPMTEDQLALLVDGIKKRRLPVASSLHSEKATHSGIEKAESTEDKVEASATLVDAAHDDLEMVNSAQSMEGSLDKLGHVGAIIAGGIGLLTTPWKCYKESRWPTREEGVKLGLCVVAVALAAVAIAVPVIAAGAAIAIAAVGFFKTLQNIRIKKEELRRLEELVVEEQKKIQDLNKEIETLRKDNSAVPEEKQKQLLNAVDRYVLAKHKAHHLHEEINHSTKSLPDAIYVASSAVAVVGAVLTLVFPPVGIALLVVAGVASLLTSVITAAAKWYSKRQDQLESKAQEKKEIPKENANENANEHANVNASANTQREADQAELDSKVKAPAVDSSSLSVEDGNEAEILSSSPLISPPPMPNLEQIEAQESTIVGYDINHINQPSPPGVSDSHNATFKDNAVQEEETDEEVKPS